MIYIAGPGTRTGAGCQWSILEGSYSEYYPNISQDEEGMKRLFTQFSFPGGIPSHVAPETPRFDPRRRRTGDTLCRTPTERPSTTRS